MSEIIGRRIAGKFVVERQIGSGAMGTVYRARQIDLDKQVALKVLHEPLAKEEEYAARFKREAKAASKIDHPNSMRVLDFGQEPDGLLYIAMELLDGRSLHEIIRQDAPLPTPRIVDLTRQILAALAAAHDMDILHRDLKPENIIIVRKRADEGNEREIVKVCDFGIAKVNWGSAATAAASKLTGAGAIVGTPDYMSPEQARGQTELDVRADLYSVGVMLYEMMTGRLPFVASTPLGVVLMHINERPKPPREIVPSVDPRLEAICLRAMAKDRDKRAPTARAMRTALSFGDVALESIPGAPSSQRKLSLVVDGSAATQTSMAAPQSMPPAPVSSAAELLATPDVPKHSLAPAFVVLALLLAGGAAGTYVWRRAAPRAVAAATTQAPSSPSSASSARGPLGVPTGAVAAPVPSAMASSVPSAVASSVPSATESALPSAPPSAFAFVPPAPLPGHEGDSGSTPAPSASASAAPANASPLRVVVGDVSAERLTVSSVTSALPVAQFERCYREAASSLAKAPTGSAKLHIVLTATSTEGSFSGPAELAKIGACIVAAANKMPLDVPTGGAAADVTLTFKSD